MPSSPANAAQRRARPEDAAQHVTVRENHNDDSNHMHEKECLSSKETRYIRIGW